MPQTLGGGRPGDVYLLVRSDLQPAVTIPFEGNVWDHAPPTTIVAPDPNGPQGTDVYIFGDAGAALPLSLDVAGGSVTSTPPCPGDRVPGP